MADIRLTVEATKFNLALKEMQRRLSPNVGPARIIEYETGKVLEAALARTSRATKASIRLSMSKETSRGLWKTYDIGNGKMKYNLHWHYPNYLWVRIQDKLAESLDRKVGEIGLSKRMLLGAAQKLGITINAPGYVSQAHPFHTEDITTGRTTTAQTFTLTITWNSPLLSRFSSLPKAIFAAIVGRRKNIEQSCARGTFNELSAVAKQFPGLIVTGGG